MNLVVGIVTTNPSAIFAWFIAIALCQLLIWIIARYTSDIEWWKAGAFGTVAYLMVSLVTATTMMGGLAGLVGGYVLGSIILWVVSGIIYQMDTWQRITLALVCPLLAGLAHFGGTAISVGIGTSAT